MSIVSSGTWKGVGTPYSTVLDTFLPNSGFVLCPGILDYSSRYGFRAFCEEQTSKHPGYYISPLCANGSAIETLFSQLRYATRGNLTSVSYAPARAQLITKRSVHGSRSTDDYRDAPLYIKKSELPFKNPPPKNHFV